MVCLSNRAICQFDRQTVEADENAPQHALIVPTQLF